MYNIFPSGSLSVHLRPISCLTQSSPGFMCKYITKSTGRRRRSRGELEFREAEEEEEEEEERIESNMFLLLCWISASYCCICVFLCAPTTAI